MVVLFDLAAGAVVGAVIGLIGAGGSMLTVPLLVYGIGMPLRQATATEQVIVLLSSAAALLPRRHHVDWRVTAVVACIGVPFTALGNIIGRHITDSALSLCFVGVMLAAAVLIMRGPRPNTAHAGAGGLRSRLLPMLATGAGASLLAGLLGVGGGFLLVPGLAAFLGMSASGAVATALVIVVINACASILGRLTNPVPLPWQLTITLAGVAVVVSMSVSRFAMRIPDHILRRSFAAVVVTVAGYMTVTALLPIFGGTVPGKAPATTYVQHFSHRRRYSAREQFSCDRVPRA